MSASGGHACVHQHARRRGFTLTELLLVAGTVAVITALLLPSLGRARELARMAQCASNEHQLGVATTRFCMDNVGKVVKDTTKQKNQGEGGDSVIHMGGMFPDFIYDWEPGNSQSGVILIHYQPKWSVTSGWSNYDPRIMVCPSDPAPVEINYEDVYGNALSQRCSYSVNVDFLIRDHRYQDLKSPSTLAWLWDGEMSGPTKQGAYQGTRSFADTAIAYRHMGRAFATASLDPHSTMAGGDLHTPMAVINPFMDRTFAQPAGNGNGNGNGNGGGSVTLTGEGIANVLWADGHVTQERSLPVESLVMQGDQPIDGPGSGGN